jgi:Lon protease-like protein
MPFELPLFPLRVVLFPGMTLPLHIFEPRYRKLVRHCLHHQAPLGLVLIAAGEEVGAPAVPHRVGTLADITHHQPLPDGRSAIEVTGRERFSILGARAGPDGYLLGSVERFPLAPGAEPHTRRAVARVAQQLARYRALLGQAAPAPLAGQASADESSPALDAAEVAFQAASTLQVPTGDQQALLECAGTLELLQRANRLLSRELGLLPRLLDSPSPADPATLSPN